MQQAERVAAAALPGEYAAVAAPARPRLWSPTFALVCAVSFFCYVHWCLLGPIMPLWIQAHEGWSNEPYAGGEIMVVTALKASPR